MHSLPLFVKLAGQPVILVGTGDAAEAKRRLIERAGAIAAREDSTQARIAFVALEDETEAAAAAKRLKDRGLLVNVADMPKLCDFTTPSIVDRDPVLIAVSTGGASAGLAKMVRQRIEAMLPQGLGRLATALRAARSKMREKWPDASNRRRAIDAALSEGGALDPLREHDDDAVGKWLTGTASEQSGSVMTIRLRSGEPDDLTLRECRALGVADGIVVPPGLPPAILARARADAKRTNLAERETVHFGEQENWVIIEL